MHLSSTIITLSLLGAAAARIVGIAAPHEVAASSNFAITIVTENYIQSVTDISATFGITETVYPDSLGTYLTSTYLGPANSNIVKNISVVATLPSSYAAGSAYYLTAAITSLDGAASQVMTTLYSVPFTVGTVTSTDLTSTTDGTDSCSATSPKSVARNPDTDIATLITSAQTGLNSLIDDILRSDLIAAQSDYNSTQTDLDDILAQTQIGMLRGKCVVDTPSTTLAQAQAVRTIQAIQATLNRVSVDVANGNDVSAPADACAAVQAYSGLHEYVYGTQ